MQVVLLERVEKLGQIGDVVKVKDGFARNFLLPKKKALRPGAAKSAKSKTNPLKQPATCMWITTTRRRKNGTSRRSSRL